LYRYSSDSLLCLETRQGLGAVEEVFGPVAAPLYALRIPTAVSAVSPDVDVDVVDAAVAAAAAAAAGDASAEVAPGADVAAGVGVGADEAPASASASAAAADEAMPPAPAAAPAAAAAAAVGARAAFAAAAAGDGPAAVGGTSGGKLDLKVGMQVFVVEGRSRVLETRGLYSKGYDNSGQNDEEVDDEVGGPYMLNQVDP
jgi:hypothetical protein